MDRPLATGNWGRTGRVIGWAAFALALGATFWLYTRPDFMLEFGAFLALCGISL
jgi:hypothetical protein